MIKTWIDTVKNVFNYGGKNKLKIFRLNDGEDWWVCAYDEDDALAVGITMDIGIDDDFESVTVNEQNPNDLFTITMSDGYHESEKEKFPSKPYRERGYWKVTATFSEWAKSSKHGDLIASTIW